jgi:predicted nucleotidyltransferase
VIDALIAWAKAQPDVTAVALVGSYAYDRPRMGSDVDLVLLTTSPDRHTEGLGWALAVDPRARLIRDRAWGPLRERRVRLRSGLQIELGIVTPEWAALPLDEGTATVLRDGCRILFDPDGVLDRAIATL